MHRVLGVLVTVLSLISSQADAQVRLQMKYPPSTNSTTELDSKTHQILTLNGMDIETTSNTFIVISKKIGTRGADGTLPVEEKINVLQSNVDLPGGTTIQFDSANPDKKSDNPLLEPLIERMRVTFKHPVTTILDSKNEITEIKLPEGVVDTLDKANKSLFDPARRKKAAEQARNFLPDEAVKEGDTWERSNEADLGAGQSMAFRTKYTYAGTVERDGHAYEKITAKVFEASYSIDQTNTTIQVTKSDLKVTESQTEILFEPKQGYVQQKNSKLRIEGPLTLVVAGTPYDGKVDLTIEERSKRQK